MNKKRIEQILRILLIPFTSIEFLNKDNDFILKYYKSLYTLKETSWQKVVERQKAEKNVRNAEKEIHRYLMKHVELVYSSFDDTMLILDKFYPKSKVYQALKQGGNEQKEFQEIFDKIYLEQLAEISKSLLTFRNGMLSIRTWNMEEGSDIFSAYGTFNKVEIWNTLCRLMPTDILNIIYYLECEMTEPRYLQNEYGRISLSDNILDMVLKKGIAENHVHFSVAYNYSSIWLNTMNIFAWAGQNLKEVSIKSYFPYKQMLIFAGILRFIIVDYIKNKQPGENIREYASRNDIEEILFAISDGKLFEISDSLYHQCEAYIENQYTRFLKNNFFEKEKYDIDVLLYAYLQDCISQNTTSESILLFEWLKCLRETNDNILFSCLIQYLRIKNSFFANIFQNNRIQGLEHFQYFFENASGAKIFIILATKTG